MKCRGCGKEFKEENMGAWNEFCQECLRKKAQREEQEIRELDEMINQEIKEGLK